MSRSNCQPLWVSLAAGSCVHSCDEAATIHSGMYDNLRSSTFAIPVRTIEYANGMYHVIELVNRLRRVMLQR